MNDRRIAIAVDGNYVQVVDQGTRTAAILLLTEAMDLTPDDIRAAKHVLLGGDDAE